MHCAHVFPHANLRRQDFIQTIPPLKVIRADISTRQHCRYVCTSMNGFNNDQPPCIEAKWQQNVNRILCASSHIDFSVVRDKFRMYIQIVNICIYSLMHMFIIFILPIHYVCMQLLFDYFLIGSNTKCGIGKTATGCFPYDIQTAHTIIVGATASWVPPNKATTCQSKHRQCQHSSLCIMAVTLPTCHF